MTSEESNEEESYARFRGKYDWLIVGAGLTGSTFAQKAKEAGKRCLVIDQRPHIGGNCYTEEKEGTQVHVYGPHVFHCNDDETWGYVNRFTKFNHFVCRPKVNYQGKMFSFPINMMTLYQLWGVQTPAEAKILLAEVTRSYRERYPQPRNMEEWALTQVGRDIYERFVYGYTTKQWMRTPDKLPASILRRLPIRLTWDDNYFNDKYQGIPIGGYTQIFENMLQGIEVQLGVDFFKEQHTLEAMCDKILYTGPIDKLYGYVHGELEYRTLRFEHTVNLGDVQGTATVNYTERDIPWTRQVEHKHFEFKDNLPTSVVTREFPEVWTKDAIPYYPINDDKNGEVYQKYKKLADSDPKYVVGGRLGRYTYTDMGPCVSSALALAKRHL